MLAVKERIDKFNEEIKNWQKENKTNEDLLPETYFKLKHPDNE